MNSDVEELLREGMARITADLRAPAGMTGRAVRRRRRRLALGSVTGVAAAAACAVVLVLVAAGVPGTGDDSAERPVVAAAYVVKHVDGALSAAGPGEMAQMTFTTSGSGAGFLSTITTEEWSYGNQWRSVTYAAGELVTDTALSTSSVYTLVNYPARTWARVPEPGLGGPSGSGGLPTPASGPGGCWGAGFARPTLFGFGLLGTGFFASPLPATVVKDLHTAISCGALVEAGRQRVDGIDAIELKSRPGGWNSETIWVNPDTYLPVRVVITTPPGQPAVTQTADITWLKPTTQNLAKLTVPIPAGFRQVPLTEAGTISIHLK